MKFVAIISALAILLLSFRPASGNLLVHPEKEEIGCEQSCADDECSPLQEQDEEKKDDCCDSNCNPVQCCCFHAFFSPDPPLSFTVDMNLPADKSVPLYTSFLSSQHIVDFWQPPRFV